MSSHDQTLKLVTNLDRAGVEKIITKVRDAAQAGNLSEVVQSLAGIEGSPRAQFELQVKDALKLLAGKAAHGALTDQLELVELNLRNLK